MSECVRERERVTENENMSANSTLCQLFTTFSAAPMIKMRIRPLKI